MHYEDCANELRISTKIKQKVTDRLFSNIIHKLITFTFISYKLLLVSCFYQNNTIKKKPLLCPDLLVSLQLQYIKRPSAKLLEHF